MSAHFLKDLSFQFDTVSIDQQPFRDIAGNQEWNLARIGFHRVFEEIVKQMTLVAKLLQRISPNKRMNLVVLSVDIYPETSESLFNALAKSLEVIGISSPKLITRSRLLYKKNERLSTMLDWDSPDFFSRHDLIFVLCSPSNLSLLVDVVRNQTYYKHTLFFTSTTGVALAKLGKILKSDLVINPFTSINSIPDDITLMKSLNPKELIFEEGFKMPDLKNLKSIFLRHLMAKGISHKDAKK